MKEDDMLQFLKQIGGDGKSPREKILGIVKSIGKNKGGVSGNDLIKRSFLPFIKNGDGLKNMVNNAVNSKNLDEVATTFLNSKAMGDIAENVVKPETMNKIAKVVEDPNKLAAVANTFLNPENDNKVAGAKQKDVVEETSNGDPIRNLVNVFFGVGQDLKKTHPRILVPFLIAFVATCISILVSFILLVKLILKFNNGLLIRNPLNVESLDYLVAKSLSSRSKSSFPYWLFLVLPFIQLLPAAFALWYVLKMKREGIETPGIIITVLIILIIQAILCMIFNFSVYFMAAKSLSIIKARLVTFNTHVFTNIYKDQDFLKQLSEYNSNPFSLRETIQKAFKTITQKTSAEDLAKAMFTVNLFLHYQKMGSRNRWLPGALNVFNPLYIVQMQMFYPSDYLFRKSTFIENYSDMMINPQSKLLPPELLKNNKVINNAMIMCEEMSSDANTYANAIHAEDGFVPFVRMAILMTLIQLIPIITIALLLRNPSRRNFILDLLARFMKENPSS